MADQPLHRILASHARSSPDKAFVSSHAASWTYAGVEREANRAARSLAALGVVKGDTVLTMLPSSVEYLALWFALGKLGAICVPINDAYKGRLLLHQLNDSEARVMIIDAELFERLIELRTDLIHLRHLVVAEITDDLLREMPGGWSASSFTALFSGDDSAFEENVEPWDTMAVFYTSGTTGPSIGVVYTHAQALATAAPMAQYMSAEEVFYFCAPFFHVALPHCVGAVLIPGGSFAIRGRFSVDNFWPDVRSFGATATMLLGAPATLLLRCPASEDDRDHRLRKVLMVPLLKELDEFKRRFGLEVMTWYNMTEVSTPIHSDGFSLFDHKSCGRPRPGIEARIVDVYDRPLPPDTPGELVLRSQRPWEFSPGYWKDAQATLAAWRNLWFHTGDLFTQDSRGHYYFVDRIKDAIRRRGENISSYELESEINRHPAVAESAAVAVPSEYGEDEIKVVITLKPGPTLTPQELIHYLEPRLPRFMIPRYVQMLAGALPKTPTGKVQKHLLRATGLEDVWDRNAPGAGS